MLAGSGAESTSRVLWAQPECVTAVSFPWELRRASVCPVPPREGLLWAEGNSGRVLPIGFLRVTSRPFQQVLPAECPGSERAFMFSLPLHSGVSWTAEPQKLGLPRGLT